MKDGSNQLEEQAPKRRFARDLGASLVEYALLIALIAVVCLGAVTLLGNNTGNSVTNSANSIYNAN